MTGEPRFFDGPDGVRLAARVAGPEDAPPVVFVHGFSQGALAWARQLGGPLARRFRLIAPDLRGHGASALGADPGALARGESWGGDLAAAVRAFAGGRAPALVGWSYGGRVLCEYLRMGGAARGLVFVAAIVDSAAAGAYGPLARLARTMCEDDLAISLPASAAFVDGCVAAPLDPETRDLMIGVNAAVAPATRRAMLSLVSDNAALLRNAALPTLTMHGGRDLVVAQASSDGIAALTGARRAFYPELGHAPFLEDPTRFGADLGAFLDAL